MGRNIEKSQKKKSLRKQSREELEKVKGVLEYIQSELAAKRERVFDAIISKRFGGQSEGSASTPKSYSALFHHDLPASVHNRYDKYNTITKCAPAVHFQANTTNQSEHQQGIDWDVYTVEKTHPCRR